MPRQIDAKLTETLEFLEQFIKDNGYSPSVREICASLSIKSTATAYYYLERLNDRGLIKKAPTKNRALGLVKETQNNIINVPVLGRIAAGDPISALENFEEYYPLPTDFFNNDCKEVFMLNVKGESMIDAGIFNGDKIVVRKQAYAYNGDIVVAMMDERATVKRFYKKADKIVLHPENANMNDIIVTDVVVLGVVIGLVRKF